MKKLDCLKNKCYFRFKNVSTVTGISKYTLPDTKA